MDKSPRNNTSNRIAQLKFDIDLKQIEPDLKGLVKECLNSSKGAKIKKHDEACNKNLKKVFFEVERLSDLLKKFTANMNKR